MYTLYQILFLVMFKNFYLLKSISPNVDIYFYRANRAGNITKGTIKENFLILKKPPPADQKRSLISEIFLTLCFWFGAYTQ